jgi:hypothetical protein
MSAVRNLLSALRLSPANEKFVTKTSHPYRGAPKAGTAGLQPPKPSKTEIQKPQICRPLLYQTFHVIHSSTEISHLNRLISGTLEF